MTCGFISYRELGRGKGHEAIKTRNIDGNGHSHVSCIGRCARCRMYKSNAMQRSTAATFSIEWTGWTLFIRYKFDCGGLARFRTHNDPARAAVSRNPGLRLQSTSFSYTNDADAGSKPNINTRWRNTIRTHADQYIFALWSYRPDHPRRYAYSQRLNEAATIA